MAGIGQIETVSKWLVLIGGLNWGLAGIGGFAGTNLNVINLILGNIKVAENLVYVLVGLSAAYMLYGMFGKK